MNRNVLLSMRIPVSGFFLLMTFSTGMAQINADWWQMLPPDWQTNPYPRDTVSILKVADTTVEGYASLNELWHAIKVEVIPVDNPSGGECNRLDTNDYLGDVKMFFDSNNYYVLFNVNDENINASLDQVEIHLAPYVDSINPGRPILPAGYDPAGLTEDEGDYFFGDRWISGEEYVRMSYRGSWSEVGAYKTTWYLETHKTVYPSTFIYTLNKSPEGDVLDGISGGTPPVPFSSVYEPKTGGYYFLAVMPLELFPEVPDPVIFPAMSVAFMVRDGDANDTDCDLYDDNPDPQPYVVWGATTSSEAYWAIAFYGGVGVFDFGFRALPEIIHVCPGQSTGSVSLSVVSGHPPYSILWSTGDTTAAISGLPPGTYWYNAVDALDNMIMDTITINEVGSPVAEITDSSGTSFHGFSDGSAEVIVTGGAAPYEYLWDDPMNNSVQRAENLTGNSVYHVTVTDKNGCKSMDSTYITDTDQLFVEIIPQKDHLCEGDTNGSAKAVPYYAKLPVEFLWDSPLNTTDSVAVNLKPGINYHVQVEDADGRTGFDSIQLSQAVPIFLDSVFIVHVDSCFGFENGSIAVLANIFTGSQVEYSIDNGQTYQSEGYFTNLSAGAHQVLIRDADQCILQVNNIKISQPEKIQTGFISGSDDVIEWDLTLYSLTNKPGSVYNWIVEGGNIVLGQGSNLINVHWGSGLTGTVSVVETNATGCTGDTVSLAVSIRGVGIQDEENGSGQVIVYPNPFSETAIITFPNPGNNMFKITITDLSGKVCRNIQNIAASEFKLERGNLQKGFYAIELLGPKIYRGKFIIN